MSAGLFYSGGKDSAFCLQVCSDVTHLITTYDREQGRLPIQGIRLSIIRLQAQRLGLELIEVPLPPNADNKAWIRGIRRGIKGKGLTSLVFGDLFLEDIRQFRERALAGTECEVRFPLWGKDTATMARRIQDSGIECRLCSVNALAVPTTYLSAHYDQRLLESLPVGVDPCGENGEFHTIVTAAPGMAPIELTPEGTIEALGYTILDYAPT